MLSARTSALKSRNTDEPVTISGDLSKQPNDNINTKLKIILEFNTFYARFEAHNTAHRGSAPAAAAEEASPLSLSVGDVTRSFKWVNIRKAVGPDGIPGRVLKACAFQPSVPLGRSLMLKKNKNMLE